jgi:hypothetical protein
LIGDSAACSKSAVLLTPFAQGVVVTETPA